MSLCVYLYRVARRGVYSEAKLILAKPLQGAAIKCNAAVQSASKLSCGAREHLVGCQQA